METRNRARWCRVGRNGIVTPPHDQVTTTPLTRGLGVAHPQRSPEAEPLVWGVKGGEAPPKPSPILPSKPSPSSSLKKKPPPYENPTHPSHPPQKSPPHCILNPPPHHITLLRLVKRPALNILASHIRLDPHRPQRDLRCITWRILRLSGQNVRKNKVSFLLQGHEGDRIQPPRSRDGFGLPVSIRQSRLHKSTPPLPQISLLSSP
jgi:hypothetical protein